MKAIIIATTLLLATTAAHATLEIATGFTSASGPIDFTTSSDWIIFAHDGSQYAEKQNTDVLSFTPAFASADLNFSPFLFKTNSTQFVVGDQFAYNSMVSQSFELIVEAGTEGSFFLYLNPSSTTNFLVQSQNDALNQEIEVALGSGYLEIEYKNTGTESDVITIISPSLNDNSIESPTIYYAISSTQIPEPSVLSFIAATGAALFIIRRLHL